MTSQNKTKMGTEFNLSELTDIRDGIEIFELADIKEFIKRLKIMIRDRKWVWSEEEFKGNRGKIKEHRMFNEFVEELRHEIDKLAGDKLTS